MGIGMIIFKFEFAVSSHAKNLRKFFGSFNKFLIIQIADFSKYFFRFLYQRCGSCNLNWSQLVFFYFLRKYFLRNFFSAQSSFRIFSFNRSIKNNLVVFYMRNNCLHSFMQLFNYVVWIIQFGNLLIY